MALVALVTAEQIKIRVRISVEDTDADNNADIDRMALEATDIVIGYIKKPENDWTPETVPPRIQSAILLVVKNIYDGEVEPLSEAVKNLLHRDRDPALA